MRARLGLVLVQHPLHLLLHLSEGGLVSSLEAGRRAQSPLRAPPRPAGRRRPARSLAPQKHHVSSRAQPTPHTPHTPHATLATHATRHARYTRCTRCTSHTRRTLRTLRTLHTLHTHAEGGATQHARTVSRACRGVAGEWYLVLEALNVVLALLPDQQGPARVRQRQPDDEQQLQLLPRSAPVRRAARARPQGGTREARGRRVGRARDGPGRAGSTG